MDGAGNLINKGMGALTVGTSTVSGTLSLQGGLTAAALPTPSAPTITTGGTAGSTTYSYTITALDGVGETIASSAGSTATGNATLTAGNYTIITWNSISGATSYKVYRTVGGATQGLITTVTTKLGATQTTNDTGLAASGSSPTTNTTGSATFTGTIQGGSSLTLGTASTTNGTLVLRNSTNANTVTLQTGTTSSSYSLVLPTAVGTTGQCLSTTVAGSTSTLGWSGCAPATGGAGYIQNATTTQTSANFNIQSTAVGSVTAVVKQLGSQTADLLQFQNSSATATIKINTDGNLLAGGVATATTGTTEATARTNVTAITLTTDAFSVNDVIFFNNAGQDYYTRVTVDNANGTYTVSPAVSYDASITVTKYTIQNIGATTTDYTTQGNRFFQGYFTGGVVTGAGSTIYSDGVISASPGLTIKNPSDTTTAFQVQNGSGTNVLNINTSGNIVTVGVVDATATVLVLDTKNTSGDPTCTNGGMYYNSNANQFRFCQNGTWVGMQAGVDVQVYSTAGANTWTKPSGVSAVLVIMCGGGGGGSGGQNIGLAAGGGGGGGAHVERMFVAADLTATVTATVGSSGSAGTAGSGAGGAGGASTFGGYAFAGGGTGGNTSGVGGGGGSTISGQTATSNADALGGQGASNGTPGYNAEYGGGGGGNKAGAGANGGTGGSAGYGAGGGGGGTTSGFVGGSGGKSGSYTAGGGGAGGTNAPGTAGSTATSAACGSGGGGGSSNGNAGGAGGAGGGGGGGGGAHTLGAGGAGGAGGVGKIWVISW